jgi:hypothetical protein
MNIPAPILQSIYDTLSQPERQRIHFPHAQWRAVKEKGWAYLTECDDMALSMDGRLGAMSLTHLLRDLAEPLNIPIQHIFVRPRYPTAGAVGLDAITTADCTAFFIFLEQCGFTVDSQPMANDLRPLIAENSHLSCSEFEIYRYPRTRYRSELTLVAVPRPVPRTEVTEQRMRTARGYRIHAVMYDRQPMRITVRGPRWRAPRPRESVTCEVCGMSYEKGDPECAMQHRSYHARIMRSLEPRPRKEMLERMAIVKQPEMVTQDSPLWMHREMYERAFLFKREFGYDFTQWENPSKRSEREPGAIGFLFASESGRIDGACAFRQDPEQWCMDFVWIRPAMRRQGLLAARWPQFLEMFGDFWIEHPLSDAMKVFVAKHATSGQKAKMEKLSRA